MLIFILLVKITGACLFSLKMIDVYLSLIVIKDAWNTFAAREKRSAFYTDSRWDLLSNSCGVHRKKERHKEKSVRIFILSKSRAFSDGTHWLVVEFDWCVPENQFRYLSYDQG